MKEVRQISMDEADRLGYVHHGHVYVGNTEGHTGAFVHVRMLMDANIDAVVVELRISKEWGGLLIGYAIGTRGQKE
jgi:hypothetical protein